MERERETQRKAETDRDKEIKDAQQKIPQKTTTRTKKQQQTNNKRKKSNTHTKSNFSVQSHSSVVICPLCPIQKINSSLK